MAEGLAEYSRGLWTAREAEADGLWESRTYLLVKVHRDKLLVPIATIEERAKEIKLRMRHVQVAMKHALTQLAIEADPFKAKLELFDMNLADGESQVARQLWEGELLTRREAVVARFRHRWNAAKRGRRHDLGGGDVGQQGRGSSSSTSANGATATGTTNNNNSSRSCGSSSGGSVRHSGWRRPVNRLDAKALRGEDMAAILRRLKRSANQRPPPDEDVTFQQRCLERLHCLVASDPERFGAAAVSFGVLARVLAVLRSALTSLGCPPPPPPPLSRSSSSSSSSSSLSLSSSQMTRVGQKQEQEEQQQQQYSPLECLLIARPAVGLTASLLLMSGESFAMADAQAMALGAADVAMAALARFPNDSLLQRHTCLVLRGRCKTEVGRAVTTSAPSVHFEGTRANNTSHLPSSTSPSSSPNNGSCFPSSMSAMNPTTVGAPIALSKQGRVDWRAARGGGDWRSVGGGREWADEEMFVIDPVLHGQFSRTGGGGGAAAASLIKRSMDGINDDDDDDDDDDKEAAAVPDALVMVLRVVAYQLGLCGGWRAFLREKQPLRRLAGEYLRCQPGQAIDDVKPLPGAKPSEAQRSGDGEAQKKQEEHFLAAAATSRSNAAAPSLPVKKASEPLRWEGERRLLVAVEDCRFSALHRDSQGAVTAVNSGHHGGEQQQHSTMASAASAAVTATGRPPDLRVLAAAVSALRAMVSGGGDDATRAKKDAEAAGAVPCLLVLVRHFACQEAPPKLLSSSGDGSGIGPFRFGGRLFFYRRRDSAAMCSLAMDCLAAITGSGGGGGAEHCFSVAAQLVASGAMVRLVQAAEVHVDDPRVQAAALQLWIAAIAALANGPAKGRAVSLTFAFQQQHQQQQEQHAWHLRHLSFPRLVALPMRALRRATEAAEKCAEEPLGPLLWLAAHGLASLLTASSSRDVGKLQGLLLVQGICPAIVACMTQALYQGAVIQQLCRLATCCVRCGPRGNVLRNEFKRSGVAVALRRVLRVFEDMGDDGVLFFAADAKRVLLEHTAPSLIEEET